MHVYAVSNCDFETWTSSTKSGVLFSALDLVHRRCLLNVQWMYDLRANPRSKGGSRIQSKQTWHKHARAQANELKADWQSCFVWGSCKRQGSQLLHGATLTKNANQTWGLSLRIMAKGWVLRMTKARVCQRGPAGSPLQAVRLYSQGKVIFSGQVNFLRS